MKGNHTTGAQRRNDRMDKIFETAKQNFAFLQTLKDKGYTQYRHTSGFTAWSGSNLCEYSDEWETVE